MYRSRQLNIPRLNIPMYSICGKVFWWNWDAENRALAHLPLSFSCENWAQSGNRTLVHLLSNLLPSSKPDHQVLNWGPVASKKPIPNADIPVDSSHSCTAQSRAVAAVQRSQMLYCLSVQHTEKHHSWELYTVYFYYCTSIDESCTAQSRAIVWGQTRAVQHSQELLQLYNTVDSRTQQNGELGAVKVYSYYSKDLSCRAAVQCVHVVVFDQTLWKC